MDQNVVIVSILVDRQITDAYLTGIGNIAQCKCTGIFAVAIYIQLTAIVLRTSQRAGHNGCNSIVLSHEIQVCGVFLIAIIIAQNNVGILCSLQILQPFRHFGTCLHRPLSVQPAAYCCSKIAFSCCHAACVEVNTRHCIDDCKLIGSFHTIGSYVKLIIDIPNIEISLSLYIAQRCHAQQGKLAIYRSRCRQIIVMPKSISQNTASVGIHIHLEGYGCFCNINISFRIAAGISSLNIAGRHGHVIIHHAAIGGITLRYLQITSIFCRKRPLCDALIRLFTISQCKSSAIGNRNDSIDRFCRFAVYLISPTGYCRNTHRILSNTKARL